MSVFLYQLYKLGSGIATERPENHPPWFYLLVFTPLCNSLPWVWDRPVTWFQQNGTHVTGCHSHSYFMLYKAAVLRTGSNSPGRFDELSSHTEEAPLTRNRGKPLEPEGSPQPPRSRGTAVVQPQGNEFCQQSEAVWKQILPQSSFRMKFSLTNTWIACLWDPERRIHPSHTPTPDHRNHEIISMCCLKPLWLWKIVME